MEAGSRIMLRRLQDHETLASPDNGQQTTEGRLPAQGSLLVAQSLSILSIPSVPSLPFRLLSLVFRQRSVSEAGQQVYKTTKQLRQPVELRRNYGIMELWNYGKGKSAHGSWLTAQSHSLLSLPSIPFRLLSFAFRR